MAAFPPPPIASMEWDKLGVSPMEVNGHIESEYSITIGEWSAPHFVEDPLLRIHGLAPGLNYGQQAFEDMKAYRDPHGQIQIFRPKDHAARLALSCSTITMFQKLVRNAEYVPPHDSEAALYIRPLVFGSDPFFAVSAGPGYRFCVYVQPHKAYHRVHPLPALVLEDLDRAAPRGVGHVKARAEGFFITLHLDSRTQSQIDEFSTSGFLGLKKTGDSFTLVVPSSPSILHSVTSTSCIPYLELPHFTEILAAGTAAMVVPIRSITRRFTEDALMAAQKGIAANDGDWLWPVTADE
ncbi:Branched-chain amino acid aminotransferase [Penicillium expansum]|nr:Branched-chain amino acid aminotransferase [Penicillium expansum]